eukprot:1374150-Pyramimonas_sp.AAC.1
MTPLESTTFTFWGRQRTLARDEPAEVSDSARRHVGRVAHGHHPGGIGGVGNRMLGPFYFMHSEPILSGET